MKSRLKAIPLELKEAQVYIDQNHRHHKAAIRDKFRIGCECDGKLVGVVQVGRPISRNLCDGKTLEVLRLCTDGTREVCSFLYSRAARVAKELGYSKIITYILETENGASLKASGWVLEANNVGSAAGWAESNTRGREREREKQLSMFEEKGKYPLGVKKQRWVKYLND